MISDAAEISNPDSFIGALVRPPIPVTTRRSPRSSASVTRRHVIPAALKPRILLL